jgi:hypothetical protein
MPYIKGTNGWAYYHGEVTAPQGVELCAVCCIVADSVGSAQFDDIEFKEE